MENHPISLKNNKKTLASKGGRYFLYCLLLGSAQASIPSVVTTTTTCSPAIICASKPYVTPKIRGFVELQGGGCQSWSELPSTSLTQNTTYTLHLPVSLQGKLNLGVGVKLCEKTSLNLWVGGSLHRNMVEKSLANVASQSLEKNQNYSLGDDPVVDVVITPVNLPHFDSINPGLTKGGLSPQKHSGLTPGSLTIDTSVPAFVKLASGSSIPTQSAVTGITPSKATAVTAVGTVPIQAVTAAPSGGCRILNCDAGISAPKIKSTAVQVDKNEAIGGTGIKILTLTDISPTSKALGGLLTTSKGWEKANPLCLTSSSDAASVNILDVPAINSTPTPINGVGSVTNTTQFMTDVNLATAPVLDGANLAVNTGALSNVALNSAQDKDFVSDISISTGNDVVTDASPMLEAAQSYMFLTLAPDVVDPDVNSLKGGKSLSDRQLKAASRRINYLLNVGIPRTSIQTLSYKSQGYAQAVGSIEHDFGSIQAGLNLGYSNHKVKLDLIDQIENTTTSLLDKNVPCVVLGGSLGHRLSRYVQVGCYANMHLGRFSYETSESRFKSSDPVNFRFLELGLSVRYSL